MVIYITKFPFWYIVRHIELTNSFYDQISVKLPLSNNFDIFIALINCLDEATLLYVGVDSMSSFSNNISRICTKASK